jgi:hypothetical protein
MPCCRDDWVAYAQAFVHYRSFPIYFHISLICFFTESVGSSARANVSTYLSMKCVCRHQHRIHEYQTSPKITSVDFPNTTILVVGFCDNKDYIHSRNNQCCALICTTHLFYILAPTCFGSSLPSSGSFLDVSELHEIQLE